MGRVVGTADGVIFIDNDSPSPAARPENVSPGAAGAALKRRVEEEEGDMLRRSGRERKSRVKLVNGHAVLALNNCASARGHSAVVHARSPALLGSRLTTAV